MEDLAELSAKGNKDAFVRLIQAHRSSLYRVARSILRQDEDCADAIQETILKAFRHIRTLKEPEYFKTWLFRILINECNLILRKRQKAAAAVQFAPLPSSPAEEEAIDLKLAVDELEDSLRIAIVLFYFEDLPLKKVAELLQTAEGTIKSRLHRARSILAERLRYDEGRRIVHEVRIGD